MQLRTYLALHSRAALALSGGVNSAVLLWAASTAGCNVRAYFAMTELQPLSALEDARALAKQLKVPFTVVECDLLPQEHIGNNTADRCFYCKYGMFSAISEIAKDEGFSLLWNGETASDPVPERPAARLMENIGLESPLRACSITREEARTAAKKADLFLWDKPSYDCLATRFPEGEPLQEKELRRVEAAEELLMRKGFSGLSLMNRPEGALLRLPADQVSNAAARWEELCAALSPWYEKVELDQAKG